MKLLRFLFCLTLLLSSCSGDPLDQKYSRAAGLNPLFNDKGNAVLDSLQMTYVIEAEVTNQINGVNNESFTYRQLLEMGRELAEKKRVEESRISK